MTYDKICVTGSLSGALQLEQIYLQFLMIKSLLLLCSPLIQYLPSAVKDTNVPPTGASSRVLWGSEQDRRLKKNTTVALQIFSVLLIHEATDLRLAFLKFMKIFTESVKRKKAICRHLAKLRFVQQNQSH